MVKKIKSIIYILYNQYFMFIFNIYSHITYTEISWRPQYILERADFK